MWHCSVSSAHSKEYFGRFRKSLFPVMEVMWWSWLATIRQKHQQRLLDIGICAQKAKKWTMQKDGVMWLCRHQNHPSEAGGGDSGSNFWNRRLWILATTGVELRNLVWNCQAFLVGGFLTRLQYYTCGEWYSKLQVQIQLLPQNTDQYHKWGNQKSSCWSIDW